MRTSLLPLVHLLLFSIGCSGISAEERSALLEELSASRAAADSLDGAREAGITDFLSQPQIESHACGTEVLLDHPLAINANNRRQPLGIEFNFRAGTHGPNLEQLQPLLAQMGTRHVAVVARMDSLRRLIEGEATEEQVTPIRAQIADLGEPVSWYRYEVLYAVMSVEMGLRVGGIEHPSRVRGRAFVWDHSEGTVICASEIERSIGDELRVYHDRGEDVVSVDVQAAARNQLMGTVRREALDAIGIGVNAPST